MLCIKNEYRIISDVNCDGKVSCFNDVEIEAWETLSKFPQICYIYPCIPIIQPKAWHDKIIFPLKGVYVHRFRNWKPYNLPTAFHSRNLTFDLSFPQNTLHPIPYLDFFLNSAFCLLYLFIWLFKDSLFLNYILYKSQYSQYLEKGLVHNRCLIKMYKMNTCPLYILW